jgi:uncharacterized membrane-anchored protein
LRACLSALLEGETWQTNIKKYQHHKRQGRKVTGRKVTGRKVIDRKAADRMVHALIVARAAAGVKADGSFSVARRFANSASKKLTTSITKTCVCWASLLRNGARLSHAG